MNDNLQTFNSDDIAIIGMSCRFPKAENTKEFWDNLIQSKECITFYTEEELEKAGVPREVYKTPGYVKASGAIEDIEYFDAKFFDFSPKEAALIDPQQRIFLEQAYKALEDAGLTADNYKGAIGVYASTGMNTYLYRNLGTHADLMEEGGGYPVMISGDKDFLATRTSYKLNLTGPSMTIQTACSSSLVAIHCACEALRSGECECALAGGVSVRVPQKTGYQYHEGLILSPDGHCRAFDEKAQGTVFGSGAGVIVLKLLEDAIEDKDEIYAVIKGSAINNDGSVKAGYTAPGMEAQAAVIYEALSVAGISPKDISYVETHGTGTSIGDPIEVAALTRAYKEEGIEPGTCAIGSVKTNIGHLDTASGVAGVIKTALALKNRQIPASLNFEKPNPKIDFEHSPFYVNTSLTDWNGKKPRRAGVSSFGIGGTNAHIILEEAPRLLKQPAEEGTEQVFVLSAKSSAALEKKAKDMAEYLASDTKVRLTDVCYTAACCRRLQNHRMAFACGSKEEAIGILSEPDWHTVFRSTEDGGRKGVAFLFPGQGAQHVNMGLELYRSEPYFRDTMEECFGIVNKYLETDLKALVYPQPGGEEEAAQRLKNTLYTQPALFIIEYSLAKLLMHWGVRPEAMAGHSLGEYAAACLADVFSLEEAIRLVVTRAKLISSLPEGSMLSVQLGEKELRPYLQDDVSIAALNAENNSVISGTKEAVAKVKEKLEEHGIAVKELATSHAFHSSMLDGILPEFEETVKKMCLKAPEIPYVSTCTGSWQKDEDALSPKYWVSHLRDTVRFYDAAASLLQKKDLVLIEVGPGKALSSLVRRHPHREKNQAVLNSLPHRKESVGADRVIRETLARLWTLGAFTDWESFYGKDKSRKVRLPVYPFDKKKFWIEPLKEKEQKKEGPYFVPVYKEAPNRYEPEEPSGCCLVFRGEDAFGDTLAAALMDKGCKVTQVMNGLSYSRENEQQLFRDIAESDVFYNHILYLLEPEGEAEAAVHLGNLITLLGFLEKENGGRQIRLTVAARQIMDISGCETVNDSLQQLVWLAQTIQTRGGNVFLQLIDMGANSDKDTLATVAERLCREITGVKADALVAFRGRARWTLSYESLEAKKCGMEKPYLFLEESEPAGSVKWHVENAEGCQNFGLEGKEMNRTDSEAMMRIQQMLKDAGCCLEGILYCPAAIPSDKRKIQDRLKEIQDILGEAASGFIAVLGSEENSGSENGWLKEQVLWRGRQGKVPWIFLECLDSSIPVHPLLPLLGKDTGIGHTDTVILSEKNPLLCTVGGQEDECGETEEISGADRTELNVPYAAPETDTEKILVKIWEGILGTGSVGVNDNFFELGGTSLMITQILSGIRKEIGDMQLTVKNIYENQTIRKLSEYIDAVSSMTEDGGVKKGEAAYEEGEI